MLFGFDFWVLSTGFEQFVNFIAIFLKLCPSAISRNSNSTFSNPLNVNLLNLLLLLSCPNTASTSIDLTSFYHLKYIIHISTFSLNLFLPFYFLFSLTSNISTNFLFYY